MNTAREFWAEQRVVPVVVIQDENLAAPLAECLLKNGLLRIEITMRTKAALKAISRIRESFPEAVVGAGTILNVANAKDAISAGAQFLVSPGTTSTLRQFLLASSVPALPGCSTVSEAMELHELGFTVAKFFPASEGGGISMLTSFLSVLKQLAFCPTGGINAGNYLEYLELENVACVGGTWVTPKNLIADQDWSAIDKLASAVSERS